MRKALWVEGSDASNPYESLPGYESGRIGSVSHGEFEKLLGHPIPDGHWSRVLTKNDAICQLYYAKSWLAHWVCRILTSMKNKAEAKDKPDLNILSICHMPFRAMAKRTGGLVSEKMVEDMLLIVNGHFFRAKAA